MIELRDYQLPAVSAISSAHRGIIEAPPGSGKTIIAAAAIARWVVAHRHPNVDHRFKVAWIANTVDQLAQAKEALAHFPVIQQCAEMKLACYASALSLAGFDLIVLDECHHVAAEEYRKMLSYATGTRWGFSATPTREDDLQRDVFALIGPVVHTVTREALVAAGQIAQARVIFHAPNSAKSMEKAVEALALPEIAARRRRFGFLFSNPASAKEQESRVFWQFAQQVGIFENEPRNAKIVALAKEHASDSVLVIVGKIEHGMLLAEQIPGSIMLHSKVGRKVRAETIDGFRAGTIKCVIATSLADEGLDVPRANVLILASAGRSAIKAAQRTGRVLRTFAEKTHGTIHDFEDRQHYFLRAQSKKRAAIYKTLGYQVQTP
jgi:superfamily II DNA or RNA helicase